MPAERQVTEGDADTSGEGASLPERVAPSDAFQALGGETRIAILRALPTAAGCARTCLLTAPSCCCDIRQRRGIYVYGCVYQ
jgi:hypothetical protein